MSSRLLEDDCENVRCFSSSRSKPTTKSIAADLRLEVDFSIYQIFLRKCSENSPTYDVDLIELAVNWNELSGPLTRDETLHPVQLVGDGADSGIFLA